MRDFSHHSGTASLENILLIGAPFVAMRQMKSQLLLAGDSRLCGNASHMKSSSNFDPSCDDDLYSKYSPRLAQPGSTGY